jgi:hypothetical protein
VSPQRKNVTYIVHWPALNVVKVGVSNARRWLAFVQRGAVVVDLIEHDDHADAWVWETLVQQAFRCVAPLAFASAAEAEPYLGGGGGGYLECFRLAPGDSPSKVLETTDWIQL